MNRYSDFNKDDYDIQVKNKLYKVVVGETKKTLDLDVFVNSVKFHFTMTIGESSDGVSVAEEMFINMVIDDAIRSYNKDEQHLRASKLRKIMGKQ